MRITLKQVETGSSYLKLRTKILSVETVVLKADVREGSLMSSWETVM